MPEFTWQLEFNTIAKFHFRHYFHGFLMQEYKDLYLQQQDYFKEKPRLETLVKTHFDKFFLIANYAKEMGIDRRSFPMHCLGYDDDLQFGVTPNSSRSKIITIHDGFDIHNRNIVSGRATKTWKWDHWNDLVRMLHAQYPDYKVIQLGASPTARPIDGVDECLIDKTTITEAFDIVAKSSLHIDGDSGLVHAAARLDTPAIVLWGPTPDNFYGYDQHTSIRSKACEGSCYGVKTNWNDKCPIGHASPICMDEITPEQAMKEVESVFRRRAALGTNNICSAR